MINQEDHIRYLRQIILPEFGEKGQEKLKNSKVLIVGAGGLGGPVALYLTAAGVGHIIICDKDVVDLSNLNRQILHNTNNLNSKKSDSALKTLNDLNPNIKVETFNVSITENNIAKYATGVNIVIDCLDNIKTRLVLNNYSIQTNIPIMHAGVEGWNGQLSLIHPPETFCLQCIFEGAEDSEKPKPILGAMAGIIGSLQALETIKYLTGIGENLKNKLAYYDALKMEWFKITMTKNDNCKWCSKNF